MHAVVITAPGGPAVLQWHEVPDPAPGPGEVLVEVVATAVNRADILQRQGHYPPPPGASQIPGLECSGRIVALGPEADPAHGWSVGDEVCALLTSGAYAELVAVPVETLMPVPSGVGLVAAGAMPETTCTVWSNLFMIGHLREGETVLVHGGSSGIGTTAIQLARAFGAQVAVTAKSAAKLARCAELGASILVDYQSQDFVEAVRAATGGAGADVVLDIVGAKYLARNLDVLAPNGRLLIIGMQGGTRAEVDLSLLMRKRAAVVATTLRARPLSEKAAICAGVVEHVWPLVEAGEVSPVVDRVLPITDVSEAHRVVEASEHIGKVVLRVP